MKKTKSFLLIMLAVAGSTSMVYAHHYRVSNIPGASAQYTSVQAAHDATLVIPGDTLYIEPSGTTYGVFNWSKQLVVIGNGYFLAANPETQANTATSRFENIYISSGASSSFITGCDINGLLLLNDAHNIFIKRNKAYSISCQNGTAGSDIYVIQNYIDYLSFGDAGGFWNNIKIENNIVTSLTGSGNSSATVVNNIITGIINSLWSSTLQNNIQTAGSANLMNCLVSHNIGSSNQFGNDNGNMTNVNMPDVFICWSGCSTYSPDGRYQLKPGSVAAGAGVGGVDCGIFDGNYPYVLSGIPTVPAIYYLQVLPQGDLLNVSVKVKSHN
jgi:hypothetical protein